MVRQKFERGAAENIFRAALWPLLNIDQPVKPTKFGQAQAVHIILLYTFLVAVNIIITVALYLAKYKPFLPLIEAVSHVQNPKHMYLKCH